MGRRQRIFSCCHCSVVMSLKTNIIIIISPLVVRDARQLVHWSVTLWRNLVSCILYKNMSHMQRSLCVVATVMLSHDGGAELPLTCAIFCVQSWEMPGPMRTCSRQQRGLFGFATTIMSPPNCIRNTQSGQTKSCFKTPGRPLWPHSR